VRGGVGVEGQGRMNSRLGGARPELRVAARRAAARRQRAPPPHPPTHPPHPHKYQPQVKRGYQLPILNLNPIRNETAGQAGVPPEGHSVREGR
jgi:hypothetical protein